MKLTVSINGQDQRRLVEHVEQLVRARVAGAQPQPTQDASPPSTQQQPPDRRS
jgi:hypothetical protein